LPYLLPRTLTTKKQNNLVFIFAFGDLSYLEVCTVLADRLLAVRKLSEDMAMAELKDGKGAYENLAGVHKVGVPIASFGPGLDENEDFMSFLQGFDDGFNFSASLYPPGTGGPDEYEFVSSALLSMIRKAGFRKAHLVRPKNGTEVHARDIASRKIFDFIVLRRDEGYWVGMTAFVPDADQFTARSNERPVVSSQISISARLAKLLLNLSGVSRGQTVLDPFCGSGTILSEALLIGANCIGVDRDPGRIENARKNLEWLSKKGVKGDAHYSLKVGDSTRLENLLDGPPVDAVVTEPILLPRVESAPRLDKAKKMIRNASRLYSEALYSMSAVVKKGGRLVIVAPSLRTEEGRDVSIALQDVKRLVYLFERV
jgi:tRNA G10  N-methylase Trm11